MTLVRFDAISLEFGDQPLLVDASLTIEPGERVCLIGRNGSGKTSLLRLITDEIQPDHGEIQYKSDLCISQLDQNLPDSLNLTAREFVAEGLATVQGWLDEYERLSDGHPDKHQLRAIEKLQHKIEGADGWNTEQRIDTIISELKLPAGKRLSELSGGWRRRVALGKALVSKPELLLLDEPTNHLDLMTIRWLENAIFAYPGSVMFVTHDRAFLQRLATRIIEIDRGTLVSWPGNYTNFLRRKEKSLQDEDRENQLFDKKLAAEEVWVRQGIKARRTRNEGRVRTLVTMRDKVAARIARPRSARISIEEGDRSGRKVIRLRNVTHSYTDETLIDSLSLTIMRGDRIGLIGNNGVGKSTLLNIILGKIKPQQGTIKHGTNLEIGYFDQTRRDLELDKTIAENIGGGKDYIRINGKDRHVIGYLTGFLFSAKRAMTPVRALSGGERNRVILARLFARPTNLLILDEPTNDLDIETLEVLEQKLIEYQGTLIVVTHDREFLDNVVTSILVFETNSSILQYVGGYSDWERRGRELEETDNPNRATTGTDGSTAADAAKTRTKLSYKEQRELDGLPTRIEALEQQCQTLQEQIAAPDFYSQPHDTTKAVLDQLQLIQQELDAVIERWGELEEQQAQFRR
ncbi:MAG: ATP-binding cassette domain-containing protein [Gammaproteobacteria bacterium]|jgi:ATP-binding cassette subfamily F protein uup|nr:ABC transporter ATP-binding protein [Chromatiales bacterium]MDP6673655.1 ATP-binding cassette domain-containing protein [Gammaproteobacteria bacterium]